MLSWKSLYIDRLIFVGTMDSQYLLFLQINLSVPKLLRLFLKNGSHFYSKLYLSNYRGILIMPFIG